jgi:hypothetical protein
LTKLIAKLWHDVLRKMLGIQVQNVASTLIVHSLRKSFLKAFKKLARVERENKTFVKKRNEK